jgi:uncharacterized membrane protein YgcG
MGCELKDSLFNNIRLFFTFFLLIVFACPVFAANNRDACEMLKEQGYQPIGDTCNSPPFSGSADFSIRNFQSSILINEDSSFTVKETIDVDFNRSRHGIYREIPSKYTDDLGKTIRTPLEILSVTDGVGRERKYRVHQTGNVISVRIGDAKTYVSGFQSYVIVYKVENALLYFDNHDELYWNVTGNYWKVPIRAASADVTLSTKKESKKLWAACFTGIYGLRRSDCSFTTSHDSGEFSAKTYLNPGEGLTIAFGWDKGLVSPPSSWKRFLWAIDLKENWIFLLPAISFIFMINLWYRRGRDPKVRQAITVMYEPPKYGNKVITPAEVGALIDEKLDPKDITSTIVGLAVKGYVQIKETKKEGLIIDSTDYYLSKVKEQDENLSSFETKLMRSIFSDNPSGVFVSDLKNKFYKNLPDLKNSLYEELVRKKYFLKSPENVRNIYVAAGIVIIIFGGFLTAVLTSNLTGRAILASALTGVPLFLFGRVMPAKTRAGAIAYVDILGFQEFLGRAEKDRLKRMGDNNLFSKFLPYAIALDVADNWAKAFEGIYQEPPVWYVSPRGFRTFMPSHFAYAVGSLTSNLSSAMFSAPRGSGVGGSGSGGGGFSGGGFGGGGGGSW